MGCHRNRLERNQYDFKGELNKSTIISNYTAKG